MTSIDDDDTIIMTLRLKSGAFESAIEVPLESTPEERQRFVDAWFALMVAGLGVGKEFREAADDRA